MHSHPRVAQSAATSSDSAAMTTLPICGQRNAASATHDSSGCPHRLRRTLRGSRVDASLAGMTARTRSGFTGVVLLNGPLFDSAGSYGKGRSRRRSRQSERLPARTLRLPANAVRPSAGKPVMCCLRRTASNLRAPRWESALQRPRVPARICMLLCGLRRSLARLTCAFSPYRIEFRGCPVSFARRDPRRLTSRLVRWMRPSPSGGVAQMVRATDS